MSDLLGVLDRPHRFKKDDIIKHVDNMPGTGHARVFQTTLRLVDYSHMGFMMAYPTYVLVSEDPHDAGEVLNDILCTLDLELVRAS